MMIVLGYLTLAVWWGGVAFCVWAICRSAGNADAAIEEAEREHGIRRTPAGWRM